MALELKGMNVLITCAGRRNYLVEYFRKALDKRGRILVTDASPDAPAMQEADGSFVVPQVDDPAYLDSLLSICRRNAVGLLVSVNDLELPVLASARERFEQVGTRMAVSGPGVIDIAFDKWKTIRFLEKAGMPFPQTLLTLEDARRAVSQGSLRFPLVIKPRWGTASLGIFFPEDEGELELVFELARKQLSRSMLAKASTADWEHCLLIQERLSGNEYGLDIVNDLNGKHATTFVKRKLAMRAGETDRAETVDDPILERLGAQIGQALRHVGNLDCDVFLTPQGPRVLELNPRFGGGYPFSHVAGANVPAALLAWADGRYPEPHWLKVRPGVRAAKCDRLVLASGQTCTMTAHEWRQVRLQPSHGQ